MRAIFDFWLTENLGFSARKFARRRRDGVCMHCKRMAVVGQTLCQLHKVTSAESAARYQAKNKAKETKPDLLT